MAGARRGLIAPQPQWPAEQFEDYQTRLATATLFPAYARTVSVLTGKPFSKPVSIGEDVPARGDLPHIDRVRVKPIWMPSSMAATSRNPPLRRHLGCA